SRAARNNLRYRFGSPLIVLGHHVDIGVGGVLVVPVPEHFRDHLQIRSGSQGKTRSAMPKVVDSDRRQSRLPSQINQLLPELLASDPLSVPASEHMTRTPPLLTGSFTLTLLDSTPLLQ